MADKPICKDCKHYLAELKVAPGLIFDRSSMEYFEMMDWIVHDLCLRKSEERISLVTGEKYWTTWLHCAEERAFSGDPYCGEEAKYYEAKNR